MVVVRNKMKAQKNDRLKFRFAVNSLVPYVVIKELLAAYNISYYLTGR